MHTRHIARASLACAAILALAVTSTSCDKAKELGKVKDQIMKLVAEHGGKISDLKGKIGPLLAKVDKIPDSIPGAKMLKKALVDHKGTLDKMSGVLGSAPAKVDAAVKDKKAGDLTSLLGEIKNMAPKLAETGKFVAEAGPKVAELEKKAAEAAATSASEPPAGDAKPDEAKDGAKPGAKKDAKK